MTARKGAQAVEPTHLLGGVPPGGRRARDFLALTKPRVVLMVLVTASVGFYLGSSDAPDWFRLLQTLIGTALATAGTIALNQYFERDVDARMERTRLRPLPAGRLRPVEALAFGAAITLGGLLYLGFLGSPLSALVVATAAGSYLFAYTPMKRKSPLSIVVGAVPGALPPMVGWAAARNGLGPEAWVLFAILFLWQIPHALAIARLYRDDYALAGIRFLPVVDPGDRITGCSIVSHCLGLLLVGLLPTLIGMTGRTYFFAALALGAWFLAFGIDLAISRSSRAARHLLFASLAYLPALLALMAFDKIPS